MDFRIGSNARKKEKKWKNGIGEDSDSNSSNVARAACVLPHLIIINSKNNNFIICYYVRYHCRFVRLLVMGETPTFHHSDTISIRPLPKTTATVSAYRRNDWNEMVQNKTMAMIRYKPLTAKAHFVASACNENAHARTHKRQKRRTHIDCAQLQKIWWTLNFIHHLCITAPQRWRRGRQTFMHLLLQNYYLFLPIAMAIGPLHATRAYKIWHRRPISNATINWASKFKENQNRKI